MTPISKPCLALTSLAVSLAVATPCAAGPLDDENGTSALFDSPDLVAAVGDKSAAPLEHRAVLDWGTQSLVFDVTRIKQGRTRNVEPGRPQSWERGAIVGAQFESDLTGDLRAGLAAHASYVVRGAASGPLFTGKSTSRSAELDLSLASTGGAQFTLSAFDRGGWTAGSLDQFARRIASGDERQKSGIAFEIASTPATGIEGLTLLLRAESSVTSGLSADRSLTLGTKLKF